MQNTIKRLPIISENITSRDRLARLVKVIESYAELLRNSTLTPANRNLQYLYILERDPFNAKGILDGMEEIPEEVAAEINISYISANINKKVLNYLACAIEGLYINGLTYNLTPMLVRQIRDIVIGSNRGYQISKIKNTIIYDVQFYASGSKHAGDRLKEKKTDNRQELEIVYLLCKECLKEEIGKTSRSVNLDNYLNILMIASNLLRYYLVKGPDELHELEYDIDKQYYISNDVLAVCINPSLYTLTLLSNKFIFPCMSSLGIDYAIKYNQLISE